MEKTKLTKNEYLDSLDPDKLNLEKKDLLDFYMGEDVKDKYKLIEKEIDGLAD